MDRAYLEQLLKQVADRSMGIDEAVDTLKRLPYEEIGCAMIDQHRNIRTGQAEVIFGQGKTSKQIREIVDHMLKWNERVMVTRASREDYQEVLLAGKDHHCGGFPRDRGRNRPDCRCYRRDFGYSGGGRGGCDGGIFRQ